MITIQNRFFPLRSAACFFMEGGIIFISVIASFLILKWRGDYQTQFIGFQDMIFRGLVVAFFCQSCMYMLDLYDLRVSCNFLELIFSLIFAVGFVCIGIGFLMSFFPKLGVAGNIYFLTIFFVAVLLLLWRLAFTFLLRNVVRPHNVLIVGTGEVADLLASEIVAREGLGLKLIGAVGPGEEPKQGRQARERTPILGDYKDLGALVPRHNVKRVVVATAERRGSYPIDSLLELRVKGFTVLEWTGFFEHLCGRIPLESLAPSFFIFNKGFRKSPISLALRRVISFLIATFGIVVLSPLFLIVAILIRLDSPGSIFYFQERIGLNGKPFRLIKFRSMVENAESGTGPQWAAVNDSRITRVGKWIRMLRIDEFPQLLNVVKGEVDLVGPRPERPVFVEKLSNLFPYYSLRHTIRPGVTGWAQVMFPYCGTVEESKEKLQYDLFYVKNMSVKLDILILIRTMKIMILGRGGR